MNRVLLFVPVIFFAILGFVFYTMMEHDPSELQSARLNQPFPAFQLTDLEKPELTRDQSALQGEPMLVNVWATWCPACRAEHAYLVHLAEQKNVAIIGLNYKDQRQAANEWLVKLGDPYRFSIFDQEGRLGLDLGVYGAPETYVVDADGIIRYRHVGVVNEKVWQEKLSPWFPAISGSGVPAS